MHSSLRTFILLLWGLACSGETTLPGGTQVYRKPGITAFRVNGMVNVETSPDPGRYIRIMLTAWIKNDRIEHEDHLIAGSKLFDSAGFEIGITSAEIVFERSIRKDMDGRTKVELFGFITASSLISETIVERALEYIFRNNSKQLTIVDFENHISKFKYQKNESSGSFISYIFYESRVNCLSPGGRILLIFLNGELAAIIYTRQLKVKYFESQAESRPYKIYYMKKLGDEKKRELANLFISKTIRR